MTYSTTFESTLLDFVTAIVMVPVNFVYGLLWLLWQGCMLLWPYRKYIGQAVALAAAVALLVAVPALALGLVTIMAYGLFTYPTCKAVRA